MELAIAATLIVGGILAYGLIKSLGPEDEDDDDRDY